MTMTDIVERLRACENDPMWADHAEIPKLWCNEAADEIERLREEIKELKEAALREPCNDAEFGMKP
jgi:hypothetical protein